MMNPDRLTRIGIHSMESLGKRSCLLIAVLIALGATSAAAQEPMPTIENFEKQRVYSPYVGREYPDEALFGDTHFHTNLSFDAGLVGTTLDMDAGYRFARGEKVFSNSGQPVQLIRPLDFLVITDHAEMIGLAPMSAACGPLGCLGA